MAAKKSPKTAKRARQAAEKWYTYFKTNIEQYHEMHTFVLGQQWSEDETDILTKTYKKVPLQFNKLGTLINTLMGEQQQNTPQIEVVPLSQADEETAQIRQIVVKDLMLSTDAKTVYQVAASQAFVGGFGSFCVATDYVHDKSFEQDIIYHYLKDSTRAYWDISAEDINKTDGMHAGYVSRISRTKFKNLYGSRVEENIQGGNSEITQSKAEIALATQPGSNTPFEWADDDGITLLHHYEREYVNDKLYLLSNGKTLTKDEMRELAEQSIQIQKDIDAEQQMAQEQVLDMISGEQPFQPESPQALAPGQSFEEGIDQLGPPTEQEMQMGAQQEIPEQQAQQPIIEAPEPSEFEDEMVTLYDDGEPVRIEDSRSIKRSKIMYYLIAGDYVLDETEFPSEDLPIIFVDQNSYYDKNGKQSCRSFVGDAKDAQRYLNYIGTQAAYILKISRYDQFMGSKKNVASNDTQRAWRSPNDVQGLITYDESPSGAKPEQLTPPELSQSLTQQYQRAIEDMYTSTGLYPTRLGQEGSEVSGKAIDARTRQGSYPTFVAFNSINRAITAGGKIVNQMIPRVYDSERVLSLMMPDEGRKHIVVNQVVDQYGAQIKNDITKGTYEVRLQAGPSYEGQKQQALDSLNMVLNANPSLLNLFADLYAENLPLTNTIEIKNRLKTIVPKEILEAGKTGQIPDEQQTPSPQDQAAMAEMQYKQQQIEIKKAELELKQQQAQAEMEQKQAEIEIRKLEAASELEEQKLRFLAETQRTHSDNAIAHADNLTKILTSKVDSL